MKRPSRRILVVLSVVVALVVIGTLAGPRIVLLWGLDIFCDEPQHHQIPLPLDLSEVASAEATNVSWFGYRFEAPWSDGEAQISEDSARMDFPSGVVIQMFDPAYRLSVRDELQELAEEGLVGARDVLGEETMASDYALMRACLEFDPAEASFFDSRRELDRAVALGGLKSVLAYMGGTGIFSFETERFRGFQVGDPEKSDRIVIRLFDEADAAVELWVAEDDASTVTQADLNRIYTTLRKVE